MSKDLLNVNLKERMEFMRLNVDNRDKIRGVRSILERELPIGLDKFYAQLRATPEVSHFFSSEAHISRAKQSQLGHWSAISSARFDDAYAAKVQSIGQTHARIGLEPRWYIGGYALILEHLVQSILAETWPKGFMSRGSKYTGEEIGATVAALVKAVLLDMDLAISVYIKAADEARIKVEEAQAQERAQIAGAIAAGMSKLASKDMTYRITENLGEAAAVREDFNRAVSQLERALAEVARGVSSIAAATGEVSCAADDLARRTEQQAASLEETTAAVREITSRVGKTAEGAAEAHQLVSHARTDAEKGGDVVRKAMDAMSRIEKSSQNIEQIISTIDEIAFQTNLLALNAGVEAARAGEAGRGFAVVASEVRALAQRSAEAAKEIKGLISASASDVNAGVGLVVDTGKALERIVAQVVDVSKVVAEIATSAKEQSAALLQVNAAVGQMDQETQKNAAMVEEATAASQSLRKDAESLAHSVESFKVTQDESAKTEKFARHHMRPMLKRVGGAVAVRNAASEPAEDSWEEF